MRLVEIIPTAGAIRFEMLSDGVASGSSSLRSGRRSTKRIPRGKSKSHKGKRKHSAKIEKKLKGTEHRRRTSSESEKGPKPPKRKGGRVVSKKRS